MKDRWYETTEWMISESTDIRMRFMRGPAGEAVGFVRLEKSRTGIFRAGIYVKQDRVFHGEFSSLAGAKASITARLVTLVNRSKGKDDEC
jgi:hypothetical protein